jgi:hypothetical protein
MVYFEQLNNAGEIEVKGTDTNGDKIHQLVRPKETNTQVLHRLLSYILMRSPLYPPSFIILFSSFVLFSSPFVRLNLIITQ